MKQDARKVMRILFGVNDLDTKSMEQILLDGLLVL